MRITHYYFLNSLIKLLWNKNILNPAANYF